MSSAVCPVAAVEWVGKDHPTSGCLHLYNEFLLHNCGSITEGANRLLHQWIIMVILGRRDKKKRPRRAIKKKKRKWGVRGKKKRKKKGKRKNWIAFCNSLSSFLFLLFFLVWLLHGSAEVCRLVYTVHALYLQRQTRRVTHHPTRLPYALAQFGLFGVIGILLE